MTEINHTERAHALLGASSAARWLKCTMAPRTEEKLENVSSEYADEGTLAHEILELKARNYYLEPMAKQTYTKKLNAFKKHELYKPEMLKCTEDFMDYVKGITTPMESAPYVAIEKRVDYSSYAPEGFGTADCVIVGDSTLYVIDYKHGAGMKVDAFDNPQLKLYAVGAYEQVKSLYVIEKVVMVIIQPRMNNISEYALAIEDLVWWAESIRPAANKAHMGIGEFVPGDHCGFCRAKGACEARMEYYTALEESLTPFGAVGLIPRDKLREVIERGKGIAAWVKAVEEYTHSELSKGLPVEGLKLVEGRGSRSFHDTDVAFAFLGENGLNESLLYERVPLTVAKVEKLITPKLFKSLVIPAGLVKQSKGRHVIAMAEDPKPDVLKTSIESDFGS